MMSYDSYISIKLEKISKWSETRIQNTFSGDCKLLEGKNDISHLLGSKNLSQCSDGVDMPWNIALNYDDDKGSVAVD